MNNRLLEYIIRRMISEYPEEVIKIILHANEIITEFKKKNTGIRRHR